MPKSEGHAKLTVEQQRLVEDYMPMVRALVNTKWQQSSRELQADLVQQGYLALVDGVVRYDPTRGVTFGAYVKWRVHKYISEYQQMDTTIRKPWSMIKTNTKPEIEVVPLQYEDDLISQDIIDQYGVDEPGYETFEDADLAHWIEYELGKVTVEQRTMYMQWMADDLDWAQVSNVDKEILYALNTIITNGS